jgi:hypothetical protein
MLEQPFTLIIWILHACAANNIAKERPISFLPKNPVHFLCRNKPTWMKDSSQCPLKWPFEELSPVFRLQANVIRVKGNTGVTASSIERQT